MKAVFFTSGGIHVATMLGMAEAYDLTSVDVVGGISAGAVIASFIGAYSDPSDGLKALKSILLENRLHPRYRFLNMFLSLIMKRSLYHDKEFSSLLKNSLKGAKRRVLLGVTEENNMDYKLLEYTPESKTSDLGLSEACVASLSVPGVFPGVDKDSDHYVDGALIHALPVEAIERTVARAKELKEPLELVIFSAYPWGWSPAMTHHKFLQIPHELMRIVHCVPTINLYHDQRMLHRVLDDAKKSGVDVDLRIFMLPTNLINELYRKYPPSSYDKCDTKTLEHLIKVGHDLVSNVLKHTDV